MLMKTLISLLVAVFLCVSATFAVDDPTYVSNWTFTMTPTWFKFPTAGALPNGIPAVTATAKTCYADTVSVDGFDGSLNDFDATWAAIPSTFEYPIANNINMPASDHGITDYKGSFKVLFDDFKMYILVQFTDEEINGSRGSETIEVMWSPDDKNSAILAKLGSTDGINATDATKTYFGYNRYSCFGGTKATLDVNGYKTVWKITNNQTTGALTAAETADATYKLLITQNDKGATTGAGIIKRVVTIDYLAMTGEQRPNFDIPTWRAANGGKGISFDFKVTDFDTDDALNTAKVPVQKPADYWWNATNNDGYAQTIYSGYILPAKASNTALHSVNAKPGVFGKITTEQVELTEVTNASVFNSVGKLVKSLKSCNVVDISDLEKGLFVIRANNQTLKVVR